MECAAGLKEPYAYYDREEIDWDLSRSEGLQADIDRHVAMCERNRRIAGAVDPNATITTKRGRVMDIRGVMIGMITEYGRPNPAHSLSLKPSMAMWKSPPVARKSRHPVADFQVFVGASLRCCRASRMR